jgi:DUF4097 and DUF4098 domain-containing protein YvlB
MSTRKVYLTKVTLALITSLIISLLVMSTSHAFANSTIQDEPFLVKEFEIDAPGELQVRTSGGHITVEGTNTDTVRVEMFVRQDGQNLTSADYNLDQWEIDVTQSGNAIQAIAKHKNNNIWSSWNNDKVSISFVVYTPREFSTNLKTSGGHINAKGLEGDQNITTSGGHLDLTNLKGTIKAKTSGGHIDLSELEGNLNIKTSGGHINAKAVAGTLYANTSGGHITLKDTNGSVKAATSGGSITAVLKSIDQFVELKTSGGDVDITIPENISANLKLKGTFVQGSFNNFSGEMEDNEVEGKINGGGPKISARTSGGTVTLFYN